MVHRSNGFLLLQTNGTDSEISKSLVVEMHYYEGFSCESMIIDDGSGGDGRW